jgi:hypothetical protein
MRTIQSTVSSCEEYTVHKVSTVTVNGVGIYSFIQLKLRTRSVVVGYLVGESTTTCPISSEAASARSKGSKLA